MLKLWELFVLNALNRRELLSKMYARKVLCERETGRVNEDLTRLQLAKLNDCPSLTDETIGINPHQLDGSG